MNILSALPGLASSILRTAPIQTGVESIPKTIPFSELEKLSPGILPLPADAARPAGASFDNTVKSFVGEVLNKQAAAGAAVQGLISGQNVSLHQTMIAMEESSISFQLMVEVRNKLLESYQELMRMQV